jgi:hypothetical protein
MFIKIHTRRLESDRMIDKEKVIEELKKNQQWGGQSKVRKEFGLKYHIVCRLANIMKVREKMKKLYFKDKE